MATCKLPLVVVLGATGAGKSKLAIEIAKMFKWEVISADSMQHSSSPNTQVDQVHKISSSETKNDISREQSRDSSKTSGMSATDLSLDHVHSGVDQSLVKCNSVRTLKEKLSTQEMLTIAGFPKDADCSHHTPDLQQQSSLFQQTYLPPEQVLQSCSSYFEMQNHGSSQVALESLPGASLFLPGVHLLQRKVGSFSDNRETAAIQVYYECDRTMSSLLSEQHAGQDNVKSGPLRYPNPCILWVQCQQPGVSDLKQATRQYARKQVPCITNRFCNRCLREPTADICETRLDQVMP